MIGPRGWVAAGDRITCSAVLTNLRTLLDLVRAVCLREHVDEASTHDLQLIAEEACVNVIHHAYPTGQPGSLDLSIEIRRANDCAAQVAVLTLADRGRPFDPLSVAPVDTAAPAESRAIGGLGVHLIRQLSDRQHYRRDPRLGNVFTIEKNLAPPDAA